MSRDSRCIFFNKEHFDLMWSMLQVFIEGADDDDPHLRTAIHMERLLATAGRLKRFTIEVEKPDEMVFAGEERRGLANLEPKGRTRRPVAKNNR